MTSQKRFLFQKTVEKRTLCDQVSKVLKKQIAARHIHGVINLLMEEVSKDLFEKQIFHFGDFLTLEFVTRFGQKYGFNVWTGERIFSNLKSRFKVTAKTKFIDMLKKSIDIAYCPVR